MAGMLLRLPVAVLALSVLACAGSPPPATDTAAAPAIEHFFGAQEEQPQTEPAEKKGETPAPAAEKPAPVPEPAPAPEAPRASETPQAPEGQPAEPAPQRAEAAPRETPDAIQHFFGEGETPIEIRPEEPAKDQEDGRDVKDGETVDAFEHFFGEKPPA